MAQLRRVAGVALRGRPRSRRRGSECGIALLSRRGPEISTQRASLLVHEGVVPPSIRRCRSVAGCHRWPRRITSRRAGCLGRVVAPRPVHRGRRRGHRGAEAAGCAAAWRRWASWRSVAWRWRPRPRRSVARCGGPRRCAPFSTPCSAPAASLPAAGRRLVCRCEEVTAGRIRASRAPVARPEPDQGVHPRRHGPLPGAPMRLHHDQHPGRRSGPRPARSASTAPARR